MASFQDSNPNPSAKAPRPPPQVESGLPAHHQHNDGPRGCRGPLPSSFCPGHSESSFLSSNDLYSVLYSFVSLASSFWFTCCLKFLISLSRLLFVPMAIDPGLLWESPAVMLLKAYTSYMPWQSVEVEAWDWAPHSYCPHSENYQELWCLPPYPSWFCCAWWEGHDTALWPSLKPRVPDRFEKILMIYPDQFVGDVPKDIRNVNQHPDLNEHALASHIQKLLNEFLRRAVHAAEFLDVLGRKKRQDAQAQILSHQGRKKSNLPALSAQKLQRRRALFERLFCANFTQVKRAIYEHVFWAKFAHYRVLLKPDCPK